MKEYLPYFGYGWIILIVAIIVNIIAKKFGIATWYDFLTSKETLSILNYIFLFVIYPAIFGAIIYFIKK